MEAENLKSLEKMVRFMCGVSLKDLTRALLHNTDSAWSPHAKPYDMMDFGTVNKIKYDMYEYMLLLYIQGTLKGFDQTINLILDESHERVYSTSQGVEQVILGLYIIRGDNV